MQRMWVRAAALALLFLGCNDTNMTSAKDDDPAIELDAQAKTVRIHDDATATAPAYDLRGSLLKSAP